MNYLCGRCGGAVASDVSVFTQLHRAGFNLQFQFWANCFPELQSFELVDSYPLVVSINLFWLCHSFYVTWTC